MHGRTSERLKGCLVRPYHHAAFDLVPRTTRHDDPAAHLPTRDHECERFNDARQDLTDIASQHQKMADHKIIGIIQVRAQSRRVVPIARGTSSTIRAVSRDLLAPNFCGVDFSWFCLDRHSKRPACFRISSWIC